MKRILFLLLAVCCIIGALASALRQRPLNAIICYHELAVQDEVRRFRIVVPKRLAKQTPVLLAFHGIGDSPESMAEYTKFDELAAQEGFILAYPEGRLSTWSTFNLNPLQLEKNADLQFFDAILAYLLEHHPADPTRVYVAGMSNGASFAQLLGTIRADEIAAIVAHSGARPRELAEMKYNVPTLLIVGSNYLATPDMQHDAEMYQQYETNPRGSSSIQLLQVAGLGHEWALKHNRDMWTFLIRYRNDDADFNELMDPD
ncbi:MAG: hypothetical protein JNK90_14070 [Planctomycetaceae bacterium]|nr:hypothetical protein [Planctomycetaceae bacterium]